MIAMALEQQRRWSAEARRPAEARPLAAPTGPGPPSSRVPTRKPSQLLSRPSHRHPVFLFAKASTSRALISFPQAAQLGKKILKSRSATADLRPVLRERQLGMVHGGNRLLSIVVPLPQAATSRKRQLEPSATC